MCGGVGSRFWPYSRENRPKQFIDFLGTGRSLLQMSYDRILPIVPKENIIVVTNEKYAPLIREQLPDVLPSNILLEPARRNTAPCISLGRLPHCRSRPSGVDDCHPQRPSYHP